MMRELSSNFHVAGLSALIKPHILFESEFQGPGGMLLIGGGTLHFWRGVFWGGVVVIRFDVRCKGRVWFFSSCSAICAFMVELAQY